jgi:glycosyltransferase involved in cell wall biosynthesis
LGRFRKAFREQLEEFRPDLIHAQQPLPAYLTLPAGLSIPVVYTFHSSWPEELKLKASPLPRAFRGPVARVFSQIERQVIRHASAITVLSDFSRNEVKRLYGRDASVVPGGVDTAWFKPAGQIGSSEVVRLVTLRNLVPRMGLDSLVRAMAKLPPYIQLDIGGEGPLRHYLLKLIRDHRLENRVRLLGHVPDLELPKFYSSADWFVLPTAALEGFGLVILESLACGTPVLGTRIGAIPEVLERFDPAWVIEKSTADSIAATVLSATQTRPPDRWALHRQVAAEFDWDRVTEKYISLFSEVLGRSEN